MIALLQRVREARVEIGGELTAAIGRGILALVAVRPVDEAGNAARLLDRMLSYRIFDDDVGKMNLSLQQVHGDLMLVPQFTLAADTRRGRRPGFSTAASPEHAERLFSLLTTLASQRHAPVACGVFGADMQVSLTNDGPVTLWLES